MNIVEATRSYEAWLKRGLTVVARDLNYKHQQMRTAPFLFFRATFYRWAQHWYNHSGNLGDAPEVLAVGDLHIENFGTWRDTEGRLVWGVNDFDEAYPMPFTNDLVRLAVSALLASETSPHFRLKPGEVCDQIVDGYRFGIEHGGSPFVLMESHLQLRRMALQDLRQPAPFWQRLEAKSTPLRGDIPNSVRKAFVKILPRGAEPEYRVLKTPKGLGSLGRRRYLAFFDWQGGKIAREAKEVAASAGVWARGKVKRTANGNPWLKKTVRNAIRCADPYYDVKAGWLVRRLGPDCSRIDLDEIKHHEDWAALLYSMGQETANIHLGTTKARKRIRVALEQLPPAWLESAAHLLYKLSLKDWQQYKSRA